MFAGVAAASVAAIFQQQWIAAHLRRVDPFGQSIGGAEARRRFVLVGPSLLGTRFEAVAGNRVAPFLADFVGTFALVSSRGTALGTVAFVRLGHMVWFGWRRRWYFQQAAQIDTADEGNVV